MSRFDNLLPSAAKELIRNEIQEIIDGTPKGLQPYKLQEEVFIPTIYKKYGQESPLIIQWTLKIWDEEYVKFRNAYYNSQV